MFYDSHRHDVTTAIFVYQNNEMVGMLVHPENHVGSELSSLLKTLFYSKKFP